MLCATLTTKRLALRPPELDDAGRITELIGNWNVIRMLARPPYPYERSMAEDFLGKAMARRARPDECDYVLILDGELIGCIGVSAQQKGPDLGYWLGEPYWGAGYMTEALRAVIGEYFAATGAAMIMSGVFEDNAASLAVQSKLGFEVLGDGTMPSVPRGCDVGHYDTRLLSGRFEEMSA